MPFGFTGSPPPSRAPWGSLVGPASAASIAKSSMPVFGSTSFGKQPSTFAGPIPLSTSSKVIHTTPNGGHTDATTLGSVSEGPIEEEKAKLSATAADDALTQGLRRAVNDRQAAFGRLDMQVDNIIKEFLKEQRNPQQSPVADSAQLSRELRTALEHNPLANTFVNHLLMRAIGAEKDGVDVTSEPSSRGQSAMLAFARSEQGLPRFAFDSPAYHTTATKFANLLMNKHIVLDPFQALALSERTTKLLCNGMSGQPIADAQNEIAKSLNVYRYQLGLGDLANDLIEIVDRVVYIDGRGTEAPEQAKPDTLGTAPMMSARGPDHKQVYSVKSAVPCKPRSEVVSKPAVPIATSFRFMDLPPELRVWICRKLLVPTGYVSVRSSVARGHSEITAVRPGGLTPGVLGTSHVVAEEARDILYEENVVYLNSDLASGAENMLSCVPLSALPRLKSIMLVLDAVATNTLFTSQPQHCNWRRLQDLTGLKEARIVVILSQEHQHELLPCSTRLLKHIIDRLPATCKIHFGAQTESEVDHVDDVLDKIAKSSKGTHYDKVPRTTATPILEEAAKDLLKDQGCKSGSTRDFRWPEKKPFELKALYGDGVVDKSIVLGGG